uniref:Uncharacterized protein n=1 Tax=Rhizophora mucronata TaxID=61149 RepID=A0A2P2KEF2_RHIMU
MAGRTSSLSGRMLCSIRKSPSGFFSFSDNFGCLFSFCLAF